MDYDQAMFLFGGGGNVIRNMYPMPGLPVPEIPEEEEESQEDGQDVQPAIEEHTGYAYNLTPATIRSTSSSYTHIYETDGTTAKPYDRAKQYTILHVWSASGVLADEYLPDLYFTPSSSSASALINLKLKATSSYSSATIWCVEYIETDLT